MRAVVQKLALLTKIAHANSRPEQLASLGVGYEQGLVAQVPDERWAVHDPVSEGSVVYEAVSGPQEFRCPQDRTGGVRESGVEPEVQVGEGLDLTVTSFD